MIIILCKFPKKHYLPDFFKKIQWQNHQKKEEEEEEEETLICKSIQEALYDSHNKSYKVRETPKKKKFNTNN